MILSVKIGM